MHDAGLGTDLARHRLICHFEQILLYQTTATKCGFPAAWARYVRIAHTLPVDFADLLCWSGAKPDDFAGMDAEPPAVQATEFLFRGEAC